MVQDLQLAPYKPQQPDVNIAPEQPYDQSIPKDLMDAEKRSQAPLVGDWEPLTREELNQELLDQGFRYERPGDALNPKRLNPIYRYEGQRIPIDQNLVI